MANIFERLFRPKLNVKGPEAPVVPVVQSSAIPRPLWQEQQSKGVKTGMIGLGQVDTAAMTNEEYLKYLAENS